MNKPPSDHSRKVQTLLYNGIATLGCVGYAILLLAATLLHWLMNSFVPAWWGIMLHPTRFSTWWRLLMLPVKSININAFSDWFDNIVTAIQHPSPKTFRFGIATLCVATVLLLSFLR